MLGVILTAALTAVAFLGQSKAWGCAFAWHVCLAQQLFQSSGAYGIGPLDLLVFTFGMLLGVPVYGGLVYAVLGFIARPKS